MFASHATICTDTDINGYLQSLGENYDDRTKNGLQTNLYHLQLQSGELLPKLNLEAGEVQRLGQFAVSGNSKMDIWEGLVSFLLPCKRASYKIYTVFKQRESLHQSCPRRPLGCQESQGLLLPPMNELDLTTLKTAVQKRG
jgi:hypothetical protein